MSEANEKTVTCHSEVYRHAFYGILNAQGQFWTPLPFESEAKAEAHLDAFWGSDKANREQCRRTHKIVPVRVQLTALATRPAT